MADWVNTSATKYLVWKNNLPSSCSVTTTNNALVRYATNTADTLLYPTHLVIGGWRMFLAAIALAIYGLCCFAWWVFDSIYHNGVISTVLDICHSMAGFVKGFPYVSAIVVLIFAVPVFLLLIPIFRWFTALLFAIWLRFVAFS